MLIFKGFVAGSLNENEIFLEQVFSYYNVFWLLNLDLQQFFVF